MFVDGPKATAKNRNLIVYWIKYRYLFPRFSLSAVTWDSFAFFNRQVLSVLRHSILKNFKCCKWWNFVPSINKNFIQIFLMLKFKQEFLINLSYRNSSITFRSSHRRYSIQKAVLKIFLIFTWEQLWWVSFNKVADLQTCNFVKKRLQCSFFLWKSLRTSF